MPATEYIPFEQSGNTGFCIATSFSEMEEVKRHFLDAVSYYNAQPEDIELYKIEDAPSWAKPDGIKTNFTLRVKTYRGWKVRCLVLGYFGILPQYEHLLEV